MRDLDFLYHYSHKKTKKPWFPTMIFVSGISTILMNSIPTKKMLFCTTKILQDQMNLLVLKELQIQIVEFYLILDFQSRRDDSRSWPLVEEGMGMKVICGYQEESKIDQMV